MYSIKFSYPFSKLFYQNSPIQSAGLLQVIETNFEDLAQEFKDYDTDFGRYPLPAKGPALLLIFTRPGGIFTTVRRSTPQKRQYYMQAVGNVFRIELEHNVPTI